MKKHLFNLIKLFLLLILIVSCDEDDPVKLEPSITTDSVSDISTFTATSGGNISTDGGSSITARGVCWSINQNPTLNDNFTTDGIGTGSFTSNIEGLSDSTTYYIKSYATNEVGTSYGDEISFTTFSAIPRLITADITEITPFTAISGGNINYDGGLSITSCGVCWSTSENPTLDDNFTTDDVSTGDFTSNITGLAKNTTYYLRAYASNQEGIGYGNEISFTTEDGLATITTTQVTDITATSATSGGNITDDGGFAITAYGVCWSTSPNPTIIDSHTNDGSGTGSFTSNITDLSLNTTYYVRAYATNSAGTAYGDNIEFTSYANDGLVAYYPFNGNANDESGNSNNGTVSTGHEDWGGGTPVLTADRFGNANKAYFFNEGAFINVPYTSDLNPTQITIALWVYADEIRESNRFLGLHSWNGYKYQLQSANKSFFTASATDGIYDRDTEPALDIDTWYHLAVTFGGGEMVFYVNGVKTITHDGLTGDLVTVTGHDLAIGCGSSKYVATSDNYDNVGHADYHVIPVAWGGYFHGMLDDIRLYNRVLSDNEVSSIYNLEKP